jgi:hypothetical protein
MKLLLTGLTLLVASSAFAGEPLFKVDSTKEGLNIPYVVCASGISAMSCYRFTAYGKEIFIQSKSTKHPTFKDAGIKLDVPGYKLEGCTPYSNGYCLFSVNNTQYTRLFLK